MMMPKKLNVNRSKLCDGSKFSIKVLFQRDLVNPFAANLPLYLFKVPSVKKPQHAQLVCCHREERKAFLLGWTGYKRLFHGFITKECGLSLTKLLWQAAEGEGCASGEAMSEDKERQFWVEGPSCYCDGCILLPWFWKCF